MNTLWEYYSPVHVLFGAGQLELLPDLLLQNNIKRLALFMDSVMASNERIIRLCERCREQIVVVIDDARPDPSVSDIDRIAGRLSPFELDGAVAIGGGSIIDSAKASLVAYVNQTSIVDFLEKKRGIDKSLPLIAVPTTSGTGSEMTRAAALTYKGEKIPIFDDKMFVSTAVVDPSLTLTCPPQLTASCGMDVLSHSLEALMHRKENPIGQMLALDAARLVFHHLEICCATPNDLSARSAMSEAALKAGIAISVLGCTAAHAGSYALTTKYHIPHGEACAFLLDGVIRLSAEHDSRMDGYANMLGFANAFALADRISQMKKNIRLRTTLGEVGVGSDGVEALARAAADSPVIQNHYFPVTYSEVEKLFRACI